MLIVEYSLIMIFFVIGGSDRDDCYHDEDAESIDEDVIDEIRKIYDEMLEKKVPTYPYENYPDLSLGEFMTAEFDQYIKLKKLTLENDELDERRKVIDWLTKQHPYLNTISCNKLTDVSVQGKSLFIFYLDILISSFRMEFSRTFTKR